MHRDPMTLAHIAAVVAGGIASSSAKPMPREQVAEQAVDLAECILDLAEERCPQEPFEINKLAAEIEVHGHSGEGQVPAAPGGDTTVDAAADAAADAGVDNA